MPHYPLDGADGLAGMGRLRASLGGDGLPRRCAPRNDRGDRERDCRGCGALCYEHEGTWHRASCTDSSRTPRGEKRRTLLASRLDIEAAEAPIVRPKWCDKEEIGNG